MIVVIAILAAITIVAFNGIQERARNTTRVQTAKEWQKILSIYAADNGKYPHPLGAVAHYCLGTGNPTDWNANAADEECYMSNNPKPVYPGYNTELAKVATLPTALKDPITYSPGVVAQGFSVRALETYDPSGENIANQPTLRYFLEGANQDCVLRPVLTGTSTYVVTTNPYSGSTTTATACIIKLPTPG